jgi:uncharacterized membrane protein
MITTTAAPRPDQERPTRELLALWVMSFGLLFVGSWVPAWSGDEAATIMVVRRTLGEVRQTSTYDPALQPYYLLVNVLAVPSTASWWMRLSSVLAMASAVTLTAATAHRWLGRPGAIAAGLVLLALPATSRYAHDVRPYALSVLLAVALVWCWAGGLDRWPRRIACTALVAGLGLTQPYALLLVPVLVATTALQPQRNRRTELLAVCGCSAAGVLLISPFLLFVGERAIGQIDPPPLTPANLVEETLRLPAAVLAPPLAPVFALLVLLLTLAGVVRAWRAADLRSFAILISGWLLLPPVTLCLLQLIGGGPGLVARYWTFCLPAISIGAAVSLSSLWAWRRAVGLGLLVTLVLLGLPTQLWIRTADGHLGQRWRDLAVALDHPALRDAPLLVEGWSYRALVSNDPALAERMVLVVDPAPEGRINPRTSGPGSPVFARLLDEHGRVVVLQGEQGYAETLPTRRLFADFGPELRSYPLLPVRCAYFGEPLGVFTTAEAALTVEEADGVAQQITSVAPRRVRCAVGGA